LLRDRALDEAAEARVDPVRVLARGGRGDAVDESAGRAHLLPGRLREPGGGSRHGHGPDLADGEVLTAQGDGGRDGHRRECRPRDLRPSRRVEEVGRAIPEELEAPAGPPPEQGLGLLKRRAFRRVYLAIAASELGDSFQYLALMWYALLAGGPLGVLAVRLADSVPALLFGLHGGLAADRWERKKTMIGADVA